MAYKLQNHTVGTVLYQNYNVLNRNNMSVATVNATSILDAIEKGRKYFNCSNVRTIS